MVRSTSSFWSSVGMLCMLAAIMPTAAPAMTPAGTEITASAEARYTSAGGEVMPAATSNVAIVRINYPSGLSIGEAKNLPDGQFVQLAGNVVIAGTDEMGWVFYIESPERSAGIRVGTDGIACEGDMAVVSGTLATVNGERQINALDIAILSSGNPLPHALGISPVSYGVGLDITGLLMKLLGRITAAPPGAGYFYVDDGSAFNDGSGYTGIRVHGTPPPNPVGKYVLVTGIPGAELLGDSPIRVMRTRRAEDVSVIGGVP